MACPPRTEECWGRAWTAISRWSDSRFSCLRSSTRRRTNSAVCTSACFYDYVHAMRTLENSIRSLSSCLLVASLHMQYRDVDCFAMTAAVWALGWTVLNAPLQCLEGNTIWPHALPQQSLEINAACSTIYYLTTILASESCVWNHTLGGDNMLALCISASVDRAGNGFLHSTLFFSFLHLFWLQLCLGFMTFINSFLETG